jgi:UDP-GlcNAc:undecaprenyl-phosphate/decaprenyl-phosphate GlcNAc-1-phosphate transferase
MQVFLPVVPAFVLAVVGTMLVRWVARRFGLVVEPREDRWHTRPTALYGGVGIAFAALTATTVVAGQSLLEQHAAAVVIAAAATMFLVGVADDALGVSPVTKLILQLAAGTLLIVADLIIPLTPYTPINVLVTLFWFVGVTNALNLLDNMDGVTAGVAAVAGLGFAILFATRGEPVLATLALATAGAAAGFLVFNFKPASIFMGDSGSLFLGAMLAGLGTTYSVAKGLSGPVVLVVPALILIVPILDTVLVTVTRTLHNRRISAGGRDHSTHRLVALGFSERGAALFLYGMGAVAFAVAWGVEAVSPGVGLWVGVLFITGALVFTGYLGRMYRYDDGQPNEERWRGMVLRNILLKRRGLELLLDVALFGAAWYGAFVLYHDWSLTREAGALANATLGMVIVLKLAAFHYFDVYRALWHRPGLADVHRILKATLLAGLLTVAAISVIARDPGVPRTVFVLDVLLTGTLVMVARTSFGSLDRFRRRLTVDRGDGVVIYGTGVQAEVALRALELDMGAGMTAVGLVDESAEPGTLIHGLPVLGGNGDLTATLVSTRARYLVLALRSPDPDVLRVAGEACRAADMTLLTLQIGFHAAAEGDERRLGRRAAAGAAASDTM